MEWNEKRIAKAAKDFNKWQGKAVVMVNTSDGDVWTDVFISGNEVKRYHSDSIKPLHIYKDDFHGRNQKTSTSQIRRYLKYKAHEYESLDYIPLDILEKMV